MAKEYLYEEYIIKEPPFYLPIKDEIELFKAAYFARIPVLLKGPTGCGKTRFVEYMAYSLGQEIFHEPIPLITVACHENLTASDLIGRFLLKGDETVWVDGPLNKAVKMEPTGHWALYKFWPRAVTR